MLLRLVRPSGRGLSRPSYVASARAAAVAGSVLMAAACDRGVPAAGEDVTLDYSLAPDPPSVGPCRVTLRVSDTRGRPLAGARVHLHADMAHPGMRPVLADAAESAPGRYEAQLGFTMAGPWFVLVEGETSRGRRFSRRIDVPQVRAR
jgi:hypothetical protein